MNAWSYTVQVTVSFLTIISMLMGSILVYREPSVSTESVYEPLSQPGNLLGQLVGDAFKLTTNAADGEPLPHSQPQVATRTVSRPDSSQWKDYAVTNAVGMTMTYDESDVTGVTKSNLQIYTRESGNRRTSLLTMVDTERNVATAQRHSYVLGDPIFFDDCMGFRILGSIVGFSGFIISGLGGFVDRVSLWANVGNAIENWFRNRDLVFSGGNQGEDTGNQPSKRVSSDAVPIYNQLKNDNAYRITSCGPTALAMVINYYSDDDLNLSYIIQFSVQEGLYIPQDPNKIYTSPENLYKLAKKYTYAETGNFDLNSENEAKQFIYNKCYNHNQPVIVDVGFGLRRGGSKAAHFVVVTDIDEDGYVHINDPWNGDRKIVAWDDFYWAWQNNTDKNVNGQGWWLTITLDQSSMQTF
jgi:predicted double-glycine peptidase